MKKIQYLFTTLVLGLALTSCGDSFLTQYPVGGTLLQEQYDQLNDKVDGSVRGIYTKLYEYGSHMVFGQRSIDMYGDITCGDIDLAVLHILGVDELDVVDHVELAEQHGADQTVKVAAGYQTIFHIV
jgi:hypothetical protein